MSSSELPWPEGRFDDGVFNIGRERGFLPKYDPAASLPEEFSALQEIIDEMPIYLNRENNETGLLATENAIVSAVERLPNFIHLVEPLRTTSEEECRLLQLLFRAYAFLTSAYLLERAYHTQSADGKYGEARRILPSQIAVPFDVVAQKLGQQPFLEYHYAYSLGNFVRLDPNNGYHWSNLGMACKFSGMKDEQGFIMLHVHINSISGRLIGGMSDAIDGARKQNTVKLCVGLADVTSAMKEINAVRRQMWTASRPDHYNDFRVFIMGVAGNNSIFGDGVIYEGVKRFEGKPQQPRGQTGAQDDIIPTCDIFSGVTKFYPINKLTEYLLDLRRYRPVVVQKFFAELQEEVDGSKLHEFIKKDSRAVGQMLKFIQEIFLFRSGHWQFVQRYILQQTKHETATGGTPITSWLPNQLEAALDYMDELIAVLGDEQDMDEEIVKIKAAQTTRRLVLQRQIEELQKASYDATEVYKMNAKGHIDEEQGLKESQETKCGEPCDSEKKCPF